MFLHLVGLDLDARFHVGVGMRHVLVRLGDARAFLVVEPAVIIAAQAAFLDEAVGHVGAAVAAMPVDQPVSAAEIAIEHEVFAHQAHRLDAVGLVELAGAGDRRANSAASDSPIGVPGPTCVICLFFSTSSIVSNPLRPISSLAE